MTDETDNENNLPAPRSTRGRPRKSPALKGLKLAQKKKQALSARLVRIEKKEQDLRLIANISKPDHSKIIEQDLLELAAARDIREAAKIFEPNPGPQTEFLAASEKEVFYGGARGGGKSYSLIVDPLRYCDKEMARALILRRTMPELRDLINHSQRLYPKAFPGAKWREQEKEWRFPSGARIEFGYAENRQDALRYQGQAYTWIGIDELPQYPEGEILNDLRGSLRSVDPTIPEFIRATGNPGNVGSHWVKTMFIDPAPPNTRFEVPIKLPDGTERFISRRFIPAKLKDNPHLTRTDSYQIMLASLPEVQRKQWLDGDWDAYEGAAFPEFKREVHVVTPFNIPSSWPRFRACDWGYSSPSCVLWLAINPDNDLIVYREYYGGGKVADEFARHILGIENGEYIRYGVLDASAWQQRGNPGPSIAETIIRAGCKFRPTDRSPKSRIHGKLEVHRRLKIDEQGKSKIKIFPSCLNLIRTLPALPIDKDNPEDVDTDAEDHAYDALRYACMSRPLSIHAQQNDLIVRNAAIRWEPVNKYFGY